MSRYEWLLGLHVVAAFAMVAAAVFFTIVLIALWNTDTPRRASAIFAIGRPAELLVMGGAVLVLVFGIALALDIEGYRLWDGWILGSIVLWAVASGLGASGGKRIAQAHELADSLVASGDDSPNAELRALIRNRSALLMHAGAGLSLVAVLVLMIYKPGA